MTLMTKGHSDYMSKADCIKALLRMTLCKVFQCFIDPLFLPSIVLFSHVFHCYMLSPIVLILTLLSVVLLFFLFTHLIFFYFYNPCSLKQLQGRESEREY